MMKKIKLTESELIRIIQGINEQVVGYGEQGLDEEEDLGGMTSDPRIMAREYGNIPESPEAKAAEQIFKLFDHKIGGWTISPDHRVTQETQQYLNDGKEDIKSQLEVIINTVVSEYQEQDIDDELE